MKTYLYPTAEQWNEIIERPHFDNTSLHAKVHGILDDIRTEGDSAVLRYSQQFDGVTLSSLLVSSAEWDAAETALSEDLKQAICIAKENISTFHAAQRTTMPHIETTAGVTCWQKAIGIERVGLYIPGGTAPLFSTVLMLALPARIAGCNEVVMCTPPNKQGEIHPAILYAARIAGVDRIYKLGGVQAIGAMAYGTQTIDKVYKIFGPGNQYVTAAKQIVSLQDVAIDMPAGPSEVQIIADGTANPAFVAADFLSQAEHGSDSQSLLLTTDQQLATAVKLEIAEQLALLPRRELAMKSLENSKIVVLQNDQQIMQLTNQYAPEHLIIQTSNYEELAQKVVNAGSVFMGYYTPESAGDYASGTNHTLPTNGYAKAYSGVNLDSFVKKITFQHITPQGLNKLGSTIEIMAENEQLDAHKNAVSIRLDYIKNNLKL